MKKYYHYLGNRVLVNSILSRILTVFSDDVQHIRSSLRTDTMSRKSSKHFLISRRLTTEADSLQLF